MADQGVQRITWRSADIAQVLSLVVFFLFAWKFFWLVHSALFLGLIAVLLAIVIHAPAQFFSRWIPFRVSFALTVLTFLAGLAGLFIAVIPQLVDQVSLLAQQLPSALNSVSDWIEARTGTPQDNRFVERINAQLAEFVGRFVPLAFNLISVFFGFFAIFILAIFLAVQPRVYRDLLLRLAAPPQRERWARVYDEAGRSLRYWVLGKAATMLLVGVVTWVGLTLFEIPGALALAALAALLEFIPNFGPTIAAAPAVASAFLISPYTALYVAIFYFVLQQVQSAITVPLIERRAVDIPPAALLIWQLMLAVGFGILALFVATPLLAVIVVMVRVLYIEPHEARYAWDRRDHAPPASPPDPP
jgi:predicted PurR-regulated permease PerM